MTYEYICKACGHQWEAEQAISADPLKDCPSCGQAEAKRQISRGGGFILKGGGWYSDLYASSSKSTAPTDAASDPSPSKTPASETTADKPAAPATQTSSSSSVTSSD